MDPATSFGLAVNVITLIEFTGKLARKSYDAIQGSSDELNDVETSAERIQSSLEQLAAQDQSSPAGSQAAAFQSQSCDASLQQISQDCRHIAQELIQKLRAIRAPKDAGRTAKFKAGLKAVQEIVTHRYKDLDDRLDRYRRQLDSQILIGIRHQLLEQRQTTQLIHDRLSRAGYIPSTGYTPDVGNSPSYHNIVKESTERGNLIQFVRSSLYFVEMDMREETIADVSENSFAWIFSEKHEFSSWLRSEVANQVWWISGRPGSGKSTLQKSLFTHPNTRSHLDHWGENTSSKVLMIRHYFLYGGVQMQRSRLGLLRSIIYQVCDLYPTIQEELLHEHIEDLKHRGSVSKDGNEWILPDWSMARLRKLVRQLHVCMATRRLSLFIQIDGLDECDNKELPELLEDIKLLQGEDGGVKCCIASRHWHIFNDAFGGANTLFLHEHTASTVAEFITKTLFGNHAFQSMAQRQPLSAEGIVSSIQNKANGSLIWVKLAVRDLLQGATEGATFRELKDGLEELPDDLESLYEVTLDRIPTRYRDDAALILLLTWYDQHGLEPYDDDEPVDLFKFCLMRDISRRGFDEVDSAEAALPIYDYSAFQRAVESRTGTLVEVDTSDSMFAPTFIHKTVYEYMCRPSSQSKYTQWLNDCYWSPEQAIAEASIYQFSRLRHTDNYFHSELERCLDLVAQVPGTRRSSVLQRLKQALSKMFSGGVADDTVELLDVFTFCNRQFWLCDELLYSDQDLGELQLCQCHWSKCELACFLKECGFDILDAYLDIAQYADATCHRRSSALPSKTILTKLLAFYVLIHDEGIDVSPAADEKVLRGLLRSGADPNKVVFKHWTAWQLFLAVNDFLSTSSCYRLFLEHGATPEQECLIPLQNKHTTIFVAYTSLKSIWYPDLLNDCTCSEPGGTDSSMEENRCSAR